MEKLRQYIREQIIREVGEGTTPYDYTFEGSEPSHMKPGLTNAAYKINAPIPIAVSIFPSGSPTSEAIPPNIRIDFYAVTGRDERGAILSGEPTNLGMEVMFRILTTLRKIVKDYLKSFDFSIKQIVYAASAQKIGGSFSVKKAQQRDRLYVAYVKKLFPNATVTSRPPDDDQDDIITFINFKDYITHEDIK